MSIHSSEGQVVWAWIEPTHFTIQMVSDEAICSISTMHSSSTNLVNRIKQISTFQLVLLKRMVDQFWIYNIFFVSQQKKNNYFVERSTLMKQFWLEIIEKIGCSKSVRPSSIIYFIYITVLGRTECEQF